MHCGQLPSLPLPPPSPEEDPGRAGPGRDGPGREAAAATAGGSGPPSAALSRPRPRPAPAPGDAPPQAAASAAAAAAAAGTEQVRRGGAGRRAGRGSGGGSFYGLVGPRAWLTSQSSLLQRPLPAAVSARAGTLAYTAWAASEAWTGSLPPAHIPTLSLLPSRGFALRFSHLSLSSVPMALLSCHL